MAKKDITIEDLFKSKSAEHLLERWDYDLNTITPKDKLINTRDSIWIKCPHGIHESKKYRIDCIYKKSLPTFSCPKCDSFGQRIMDVYGADYLNKIWSDKNNFSPFDLARHSRKKIWVKCENNKHPDVLRYAYSIKDNGYVCPKCQIKIQHDRQRIDLTNQRFGKWTVKELDKKRTNEASVTYWICDCDCGTKGVSVYYQNLTKGTSKSCGCLRFENSGENHHNWQGGTTPESIKQRNSLNYKEWRTAVFKRDDYTCQCCGRKGVQLNAHHIIPFAQNESLRFSVDNGITLCERCHSFKFKGSFHDIYGTKNNTPEQLQEYIKNNKTVI